MKKISVLLLSLLLVFSLAGCKDDEAGDRIKLEFWHMSPIGSDSYKGVKKIISNFNDSQDVYYVKGVGFSFWDYWDKVNVAIASDNAPDIGFHTLDNVILRAKSEATYNISDLIADDVANGIDTLDLSDLHQNQLDFATYDDDLYALPFSSTTRVLYYNLEMFEEAGLTETDVPTTWSELETVAHKLDISDDGTIKQLGFDPTYGQGTYQGYLWQSGIDFFDADKNPTLNTQLHEEVLDWMVTFNKEFSRTQLNSFGEANQMLGIDPFAAGRVAMMIGTDELYQIIKTNNPSLNYGVTSIPVPDENGVRVNWGSGYSIELYDNNDNDTESKTGSWEFLKYLMSYDVQKEFAVATGWFTAHKTAMTDLVAGDPIRSKIWDEVEYAKDKVYITYAPNWHAADWSTYYDEAKAGTMTVQETLAAARALYLQKQENYNDINK